MMLGGGRTELGERTRRVRPKVYHPLAGTQSPSRENSERLMTKRATSEAHIAPNGPYGKCHMGIRHGRSL